MVDPTVRARLAELLEAEPQVLDAYCFGSQARGEARPGSDVDVAVFVDPASPPPRWGHAATITTTLAAGLHRNDIDVAVLNHATPLLYQRVLRDGILLVSRDPVATSERALVARSRWLDWKAFRERVA